MQKLRVVSLVSAVLIFVFPAICFAQAVPEGEDFDSVTVPALPSGWTSTSIIGTQVVETVSTTSDSSPNSVKIPAPNSTSQTAFTSKVYTFNTGLPTYRLEISFRHKRGIESSWDGGVMEISVNGAPFVDVLDPSVGGVFNSGAYNTASVIAGPLAGRKAWSGTSASFESVSVDFPSIPDNSTIQFRFMVGTDASVGGPGWFIDEIELSPDINLVTFVTPLVNEIAPGGTVLIDSTIANPSSLNAMASASFLSAPSSLIKSISLSRSGYVMRYGSALSILNSMEPIVPSGTETANVVVQDLVGRSAAKFSINASSFSSFVGAQNSVSFLSSSPAIPNGSITAETVIGTINPCSPPAIVFPTVEQNRIVIHPMIIGCPFGQAALAYQARGAVAVIFPQPPPTTPPTLGSYPTPWVEEAPTAGLTIPTFTFDQTGFSYMIGAIGLPGSSSGTLQGLNGSELRTIALSTVNIGGGAAKLGDSLVTALVNVATNVDGDSVPDYRDGCKTDAAKTAPGVCGCGKGDVDTNSNGVVDCLTNADFKAQVNLLQSLLKKLNLKSKNYKTQKTQLTDLRKSVTSFGVSSAGALTVSAAGVDIAKLTKKVDKSVAAAAKAKTATTLKTLRKAALKDIAKLLAGIA